MFDGKPDMEVMAYVRECVDSGQAFDVEGLLFNGENKADAFDEAKATEQPSDSQAEEPIVQLNVDLLLTTSPFDGSQNSLVVPDTWAPKSKPTVMYSFLHVLFGLLSSLERPLVPKEFHQECFNNGYQTFTQVKALIKKLHSAHQIVLMYIVSFIREYRNVRGHAETLSLEKVASALIAVVFGIMRPNPKEEDGYEKSRSILRQKLFIMHLIDPKNPL